MGWRECHHPSIGCQGKGVVVGVSGRRKSRERRRGSLVGGGEPEDQPSPDHQLPRSELDQVSKDIFHLVGDFPILVIITDPAKKRGQGVKREKNQREREREVTNPPRVSLPICRAPSRTP